MTDIHDDIMRAGDIDARISTIESRFPEESVISEWDDEDAAEEFVLLRDFREEVAAQFGAKAWQDGIDFIADSWWEEYAQQCAEGIYGETAESPYWNHDLWQSDYQEGWTKFTLEGTEYWADGNR